ncbi:hypothetical protein NFP34_06805 [Enterobacter hormaechei]|uniref:hypothetical protein n=1 Tax=Enterobacter hormaechei TaxID=158836 RepID=UPI0020923574|nr:hypothetical protein [Enterobacter hormaechei]MCO6013081.1 hypothetical protein [Enterobacter hormaechei]
MECKLSELVKLGHDQSAELKASCGAVDVRSLAQLISDLATQLEVQFVRSTNMAVQLANAESKCRELAAENGRYSMSAGQADQRMSESRAVRSALGFQEDADDVSPSDLVEKIQSLITEKEMLLSAHPQPLGPIMDSAIDAFNSAEMPETGMLNAFFILRDSIIVKTPATDAFLAEVRAQGVKSLSNAVQSVISERQRQQSVEGWTPEHDDEHTEGEMAEAAACYAMFANNQGFSVPGLWPWAREWWKQSGQRRDLVKAGALILAEIERIDRQESAQ